MEYTATCVQVARVQNRMEIINKNKIGELSQAESILSDLKCGAQEVLQIIFQHFLYLNLDILNISLWSFIHTHAAAYN